MERPYLSIIIPCYKEEKNLVKTFWVFDNFAKSQKYEVELVFVNDASPDNTLKVLNEMAEGKNYIRIISYEKNRGKGYAVKTGMLAAKGEILLFADADNATPIEQANKLLAVMDSAQVVIGSRYIEGAHFGKKQPFYRILGARFLNFFFRIFTGLKIKDSQCGFKMFRADAAKEIFSRQTFSRFSFDVEILAIAKYLGYQIKEVPIDWYARGKGTVKPIRDGLKFLWALVILRWNLFRGIYKKPIKEISNV